MTRRRTDARTRDLFDSWSGPDRACHHGPALRHLLSRLLTDAPCDRSEVAARMSRLLGVDVTKHQLDSWTAESREGWRFPLEYLPAFERALETRAVTRWVAELAGGSYATPLDLLHQELGRVQARYDALARERTTIEAEIARQPQDPESRHA